MVWGRLDDQANGNAKLLAISDAAWRMWGCGLIYCQANLTDGFIPSHAIHSFGVRARNKPAIAQELCSVLVPGKGPLWHEVDGGYQVHDYLEWNDSRDDVTAERERSKTRQERFRKRKKVNGVGNALHDALHNASRNAFGNALETGVHVPLPEDSQNPSDSERSRARAGKFTFVGERVSVPRQVHEKLVKLRNNPEAERELQALYRRVSDEWTTGDRRGDEPGAEMFAFWTDRYNEEWPPTQRAKRSAVEAPITPKEREKAIQMRRSWGTCQHDPQCSSHAACITAIVRNWRAQELAAP